MIKSRLILITVLIGALCIYSCGDDKKPTGGGDSNGNPPPDSIGLFWVYEVYDSLTEITDTVWISLTDTVSLSDGVISLRMRMNWIVANIVEDRYVVVHGDTVELWARALPMPEFLERFVLPLSLGAEWKGYEASDTSRVTDVGTVVVEAGRFDHAALVERTWGPRFEGNYSWSQTWVAPGVGAVSRYLYSQRSDGGGHFWTTVNQTWELLRYDLSTFSMGRFPNSIGTVWVYQMVDTSIGLVDTVTVTITSEVPVSWADSAMLWQYIGREFTDTLYVGSVDEKLFFSHSTDVLGLDSWYYEFPLAVGRHWGVESLVPIPEILDKGAVTSLAGSFPSAFHYRMIGEGFNSDWQVEDWLVPGVGAVLRKTMQRDLGPALNQDWTLMSYQIP